MLTDVGGLLPQTCNMNLRGAASCGELDDGNLQIYKSHDKIAFASQHFGGMPSLTGKIWKFQTTDS